MSTFAPVAPTIYVPPTQIAEDTHVIHQVQPALGEPLFVYLNSLVIRGEEPVIVDTGTPANREQWLRDAKYGAYVDQTQSLDITTIAGCHTPVIEGEFIERAFARVREFPLVDPPPLPDQSVLDQIIAATSQPPS